MTTTLDRVLSKIEVNESGCWIYVGATSRGGYGKIGVKGQTLAAHRFVYEALVGLIPEGLEPPRSSSRWSSRSSPYWWPTISPAIRRTRTTIARSSRWCARHHDSADAK